MRLIAELKRRKVFRVSAAYAVVAWGLAQVADLVLENTAAPSWVMQVILLVLALGFPLAVILAWAFEVTPDGVKRTESLEADERPPSMAAPDYLLVGLMVTVVVIAGVQFARMPGQHEAPPVPRTASIPDESEASIDLETAVGASDSFEPIDERTSIAVLAFENMSPDPDNAYFADGISEELLNILAEIDGLKVASRTSAFSFKGTSTPIPQIAEQLGVRHVLEGSVRKQGNRVRITAQLIEAGDDAHLWSEVYDRELDDIFAVQEEIARSITGELESLLGTRSVAVAAPTRNMDAYQSYLRGRSRFYQRVMLDEAIEDLRRAVAADPDFAAAWAFLAAIEYVVGNDGYPTELDEDALTLKSVETVDRALSLNPDNVMALAIKGQQLFDATSTDSVEQGLTMLESAASRVTPDSTPRLWLGLSLFQLGEAARALEVLEQAQAQDPLVAINNGYLGVVHAALGRTEIGRSYALRSVELSGSLTFWTNLLAIELANSGDIASAVDLLRESLEAMDGEAPFQSALIEALTEGLTLEQLEQRHPELMEGAVDSFFRTNAGLLLGEIDAALDEADGPITGPRYSLINSAWMPSMSALREHPAFFRWVSELGYVDYWQKNGFPLGCAPVTEAGVSRLECGGES